LNSLALSPRLYYFEKLVSDGEDEKIEKGNIFHDYAEFYINHPEFVEGLANKKYLISWSNTLDRISIRPRQKNSGQSLKSV